MNFNHIVTIPLPPCNADSSNREAINSSLRQTRPGNETRPDIQHFGGEKHSWNETPNTTIKAYSQILKKERDPGLVSKIETTNETVSLNSHSGLQS